MVAALTLLFTFSAFAAASEVMTIGMTGGWSSTNITSDATKLLTDALVGTNYASSVGDTRVCYTEVTSLKTQVVAGVNYRFHIDGCNVTDSDGVCSESTLTSCEPSGFVVQIFEQSWTNTLKVTSIEPEQSSTFMAPTKDEESSLTQKLSKEEKRAMDAWIHTNGLNKFGDAPTTVYLGGTPLFNEKTGETIDRYEYILRRHPDRPWHVSGVTATLLAVEKAEDAVDETQGQGSVTGVLSMLGVFTVVLTGVAILKMRQGKRDRFGYNPIRTRGQ